jgi:hypothetical protein
MTKDEAHLEIIKSDEIKKIVNSIYTEKKQEDEDSVKELSQNLENMNEKKKESWLQGDIGEDEIARVMVNSGTMDEIDRYMKEHDLSNFSETVHDLIKKGLQAEKAEE